MVKGAMAATMIRFRNRRWRMLAALAVVLLLTVQIGLAVHGASHLHNAGETGDCNLCVLNSHFVAESPVALELVSLRLVDVLPHEDKETPSDTTPQIPTARGPPAASV